MEERLLAELLSLREEVRGLRESVSAPLPSVLTRKMAAQQLSIGLTKLKGWIRDGIIYETELGGIPASEIQRLAQPVQKPARPGGRPKSRPDPRAEAAKIRERLKTRR